MFLLGFRRKLTALAFCKSIESAIQWFQIHHRITFATIQNPAVYLSGARVSIFFYLGSPTMMSTEVKSRGYHFRGLENPDVNWKRMHQLFCYITQSRFLNFLKLFNFLQIQLLKNCFIKKL